MVGDPTRRDVFVGPVIDGAAVDRFEAAVNHASEAGRSSGAVRCCAAGDGYGDGNYLAPTVVTDLPANDRLAAGRTVRSARRGRAGGLAGRRGWTLANDTDLGLTAGFFSADQAEID